MSCRSCRDITVITPTTFVTCPAPVLKIGFPQAFPGPNTVTLANGAVVDLEVLGEIISQFCPSIACPTTVVRTVTGGTLVDP